MERDENKGKVNIYAILPVEEVEISVRSVDQTSPKEPAGKKVCVASAATAKTAAVKKKKKAVRPGDEESDQVIMPSDSDEDAFTAKKAPEKQRTSRVLPLSTCKVDEKSGHTVAGNAAEAAGSQGAGALQEQATTQTCSSLFVGREW